MNEAEELNKLSEAVIGAAIAVHRELGPGLLESAYEACLEFELLDRGFQVQRQLELPVVYRELKVNPATASTCSSMEESSSRSRPLTRFIRSTRRRHLPT